MNFKECYKGFLQSNGKAPAVSYKSKNTKFLSYEAAKTYNEFVGILADNTILVDVDTELEGELLKSILEEMEIKCPVLRTTKGYHFLFKHNNMYKKCTSKIKTPIGITIDVKFGAHLGVQCLKLSGVEREILSDPNYDEIPEIPKFLYAPTKNTFKNLDVIEMGEGERNNTLSAHKFHLYKLGYNDNEIMEICCLINEYVFSESLDEDEFQTIMRDENIPKQIRFFDDNNKFQHHKFAEHIRDNFHVKMIDDRLHIYDNGYYRYDNESKIIERFMQGTIAFLSRHQRAEATATLKLICEEVQIDKFYICFNNGLYHVKTQEFIPHTPDIICTNKVPHNFYPEASRNEIDKIVSSFVCDDKELKALLYEIIGYIFYPDPFLDKCFIIKGDHDNGKSKFLYMIECMVGRKNTSFLDLKQFNERFTPSTLYGKLVNIGDDISNQFMEETAIFKKLVTGETLLIEEKGKNAVEYTPRVKHFFGANVIPRFPDMTGAIKKRVFIIPFNNDFSPGSPNRDEFINEKLEKEENQEALIQLAIESFNKVMKNEELTIPECVKDELKVFDHENNPILTFIEEKDEESPNGGWYLRKATTEVFNSYKWWCMENGYRAFAQSKFSAEMKKLKQLDIKNIRESGKVSRCFVQECPIN
ncbi:phage/plasmid primase, P4 family [Sebaldella sp. S0638]|uniref:phage/plasmid primase, P4 family n=1 Tax=Sebaldella sp. S0638 TaxID=2957809 RepID=UPI0020A02B48|nr:phage/plasmid primase, P4 family [Sebaldella sp. S0638]MCP1223891.1 phage/plasmid primase, P4 family [Sebaldella sp. S0638]